MKRYIIDTNILMALETYENLIARCDGEITIPMYVLEELDNLKTKEADKGFKARRALRNIEKFKDSIHIYLPTDTEYQYYLPESWSTGKMDNEIINNACILKALGDEVILLSNDLNVRLKCESVAVETDVYYEIINIDQGWVHVQMSVEDCAAFEDHWENLWDLKINQYVVIDDIDTKEILAIYKYLGGKDWTFVRPKELYSRQFGTITPIDEYQMCAVDSLRTDDLTVITGRAGSGKTLLSLGYAIQEIMNGTRSKLIIFANPVKARGSEQLGYYPGDRTEKLMQNSVGAMLASKFGDVMAVQNLIDEGLLEILPFSDIRGFEVAESQIMYISEAQNLNVDLAKLAIQRCAQGAKIILEGDPQTQVDHYSFEGNQNGLRRVIEVFEGTENFSHVYLPNIRRSDMANLADKM